MTDKDKTLEDGIVFALEQLFLCRNMQNDGKLTMAILDVCNREADFLDDIIATAKSNNPEIYKQMEKYYLEAREEIED